MAKKVAQKVDGRPSVNVKGGGRVVKRALVPADDTINKASDAFRTISEVSSQLDVPKHVLRFWEGRFTHLKPMKRGGGRRFYRPEDIDLLVGIRHLLHVSGYTIRGVQQLLRKHGVDWVKQAGTGQVDVPESPGHGDGLDDETREQLGALAEELRQCLKTLGVEREATAPPAKRAAAERRRA